MRQSSIAASFAASALLVTGAGIALGTAGPASAATCSPTASATKNDISTAFITDTYNKSVTPTTAVDGSTVTYSIVVGTTSIGNPYVSAIVDYPPAGFGAPVSASVTAYNLGSGEVTQSVTPTASGTGWAATSSGWFVNATYPVTFTVTYQVPASTPAGPVTSGGIDVSGTVGVSNSPALDVCFSATTAATTTTTAPPTTTTTVAP